MSPPASFPSYAREDAAVARLGIRFAAGDRHGDAQRARILPPSRPH